MNRKSKRAAADPFEQAFFDYLEGNTGAELTIHCNKGEPEILPVHYFFRTYEEMPDLEKEALACCRGKVLDVGAGAGAHSLYLQEHGRDVTALDIRPGFVEVMKKRGIKKVLQKDFLELEGDAYDTLLFLMNGVGLANTAEGLERFFEKAAGLLNPGGQILLDSTDLLYLYRQEDNIALLDLRNSYYGEVEYRVEYNGLTGEPFSWLYIDFSTLSFYAEQAGFRCEMRMETEWFNYLAQLEL